MAVGSARPPRTNRASVRGHKAGAGDPGAQTCWYERCVWPVKADAVWFLDTLLSSPRSELAQDDSTIMPSACDLATVRA